LVFMSKRALLYVTHLIQLGICLLAPAGLLHAQTTDQPNVVLILADDLGYSG